ncbi:hypothetical protein GQ44DRAFT_720396 [Phaeosphaeriaceae sp. PMI808]|nr:hypothetical protein GQ44DRAFT_720396 [Phaeosphaeriaceae sp. PMI808]
MTVWSLVEWLTGRIDGNNGYDVTEEQAILQNILKWTARIQSHLDPDNKQRRVVLISLIGQQVMLKSGAWVRLGGMRRGEFVVQDGEGDEEVVQMDEIVAEHVKH